MTHLTHTSCVSLSLCKENLKYTRRRLLQISAYTVLPATPLTTDTVSDSPLRGALVLVGKVRASGKYRVNDISGNHPFIIRCSILTVTEAKRANALDLPSRRSAPNSSYVTCLRVQSPTLLRFKPVNHGAAIRTYGRH